MEEGNKKDEVLEAVQGLGEAIQALASHIDERFEQVDSRFNRIEATMVTKSYLDDKLYDLRVELGTATKDVDKKDSALVRTLQEKGAIDQPQAKEILAMSPFPTP